MEKPSGGFRSHNTPTPCLRSSSLNILQRKIDGARVTMHIKMLTSQKLLQDEGIPKQDKPKPKEVQIRSYTPLLLNQTPAGNSLSLFPSSHSNGNTFPPSYLQFSPPPIQGLPYRYKLHTEPLFWEMPRSLENCKVIQKVTGALSACSKQHNPSLLETNCIHMENKRNQCTQPTPSLGQAKSSALTG